MPLLPVLLSFWLYRTAPERAARGVSHQLTQLAVSLSLSTQDLLVGRIAHAIADLQ
jgi:hypothetical protein